MSASKKTFYDIRDYGKDGDVMLVRIQERERIEGLAPMHSQCIMMKKEELEQLMEAVNNYYADKR
jgi:hypothetical protein